MKGKIVLITGANSGIGKATAEAIARKGATVILLCRNANKGEQARQEIIQKTGNQNIILELCDFSNQTSIRQSGAFLRQKYPAIDVLINNAGAIFGDRQVTNEGLEMTFAVNHIGYFLLTHYLLPSVAQSSMRRIVNVASLAHKLTRHIQWDNLQFEKGGYRQFRAYGLSKLCNILFTRELARRLTQAGSNITVNCLHPGTIGTNFGSSGSSFFSWLVSLARPLLKSPDTGAQTSVYLACSPDVQTITGTYFDNCKQKETTRLGKDMQAASRLWTMSMQMTGLQSYGDGLFL